jgi:hypothetical protein
MDGLDVAIELFDKIIKIDNAYNKHYTEINAILNIIKCYGESAQKYSDLLFSGLYYQGVDRHTDNKLTPYYRQEGHGLVANICITLRYIFEKSIDNYMIIYSTNNEYSLHISKNINYRITDNSEYTYYVIDFYNNEVIWRIREY